MLETDSIPVVDEIRKLERRRIEATRLNDVEALGPLLHDELIYINSIGDIYDKPEYLKAIATHRLTYDRDFDVEETDCRAFADLVIFAGVMLGHSRLDGEQQVFLFRSLSVWRCDDGAWRMVAWQSSSSSSPRRHGESLTLAESMLARGTFVRKAR
ncbi:MAG TPA: nuclear transport factor 2 family protein [Sphingomicrobium sp.]|jgi:hypothetical protein|nr:nuclear transport factor 2 family protein [Sphingomicrobium sp.]